LPTILEDEPADVINDQQNPNRRGNLHRPRRYEFIKIPIKLSTLFNTLTLPLIRYIVSEENKGKKLPEKKRETPRRRRNNSREVDTPNSKQNRSISRETEETYREHNFEYLCVFFVIIPII
jgi:hypothetical protein